MNAPVQIIHAMGSLEEFAECCADYAWFHSEGWVSLQQAVDNCQHLAELWLLVDEYGQDFLQAVMADDFSGAQDYAPDERTVEVANDSPRAARKSVEQDCSPAERTVRQVRDQVDNSCPPERAADIGVNPDTVDRARKSVAGNQAPEEGERLGRDGKSYPVEIVDLPSDYAAQIVRQWELSDFRDCWKHTGELPPHPVETKVPARKQYTAPQSTTDAFHVVLKSGDPERLVVWLRNHPDDVAAISKMLEAA